MIVEGRNAILELIKTDKTIDKVMVDKDGKDSSRQRILANLREKGVKIQYVSKAVLEKESITKHPQGYLAFVSEFKYCEVEDILKEKETRQEPHFIVILDRIEDPHNLGACIRVCDGAGVHGMIIPKNRACSVNETVVRVSCGASEHMKIARVTNLNSTIEELKKNNVFVYALDMDGASIYNTDMKGDVALVVGNEGSGIAQLTKKLCDAVVSLPMKGKVNSLNASVALSAAIYECVRQRD